MLGVPLVTGSLVRLECEVEQAHPAGDHTVVVGAVRGLEADEGEPLRLVRPRLPPPGPGGLSRRYPIVPRRRGLPPGRGRSGAYPEPRAGGHPPRRQLRGRHEHEDHQPSGDRRHGRRPGLGGARCSRVLAVVVVVVGAYVGAAYALADRVPFNTTAAGTDIGGRSAEEAVALLEDRGRARAPWSRCRSPSARTSTSSTPPPPGCRSTSRPPSARSPGSPWSRRGCGATWWARAACPCRPTSTTPRWPPRSARSPGRLGVEPVDGDVTFPGGVPTRVEPVEGREVDVAGAAAAVESMWLGTDGPVPLPADTRPVQVGVDDVDAGPRAGPAGRRPAAGRRGRRPRGHPRPRGRRRPPCPWTRARAARSGSSWTGSPCGPPPSRPTPRSSRPRPTPRSSWPAACPPSSPARWAARCRPARWPRPPSPRSSPAPTAARSSRTPSSSRS